MVVTFACLGLGVGVVALTTRPPRTTWFHPAPRSLRSAEGPARLAFGMTGWLQAALFRAPALKEPASSLSTSRSPGSSSCGHPRSYSTEGVLAGSDIHRNGEMRSNRGDAPGCASTVTPRVAKALAALAVQWVFRRNVPIHRHSQTVELGE